MNLTTKITRSAAIIFALGITISSCQKLTHPGLSSDYPKDANPPGGPLKFYAAYDGSSVDSIRANFGTDNNITYVDGISGKAMSGDATSNVVYSSANDFNKATSFTVSFWVNKAGPNPAGAGTTFAFGLSSNKTIWTYQDMFLEFEDAGNPSSSDSAACKFYLNDQWFEFVKTPTADKRLPKVLDGQWHHLAFTYEETTSTFTPYLDGVPYTNLPADFGKFTNNNGVVSFSQIGGLVVGGPGMFALGKTPTDIGQTWMGNFNGKIDQFRLYGTALSAADVAALYANKQ